MTIAQIAAYWGCPCTFELNVTSHENDDQWLPCADKVDAGFLFAYESGTVRNVTLQLRELDSLSEEEKRTLFETLFGPPASVVTLIAEGSYFELSAETQDGSKRLTVWDDGEWYVEHNGTYSALFRAAKAVDYLRSIHVRVEGKGVVND